MLDVAKRGYRAIVVEDAAPRGLGAARAAPDKRYVRGVLLFLVGMVVVWTILCGISHRAPDLDNMEELIWASSFEWGYFKHPPVPSWFLYPLTWLFGKPIWLTFFAGQLLSALALWFVWKLGCEFTTPRRAMIAMLAVSVTAYFSVRATIYNHNTAQLWSIVASTWLYYRALRYGRAADWLWLGAVCGVAFLTKYSALIQFAAFFVFFVHWKCWRERGVLKGVALALCVFLVVVAPHLVWLFHHGFEPLYYADVSIEPKRAGVRPELFIEMWNFFTTQLARLSPMLIAWIAVRAWNRKVPSPAAAAGPCQPYVRALSAWDQSFLLIVGIGPVALTVLMTAILGTRLGSSWPTTFFVLFGFYTFWWLRGDERVNLHRTAVVVVAIQVLMAGGYALGRGPLAYYTGYKTDSTYPGKTISRRMHAIWRRYVPDSPLRLVAANTWLGGNIAVHVRPAAYVFVDASREESPWLKNTDVMRCGMLVAYSMTTHSSGPSAALRRLYEEAPYKGVLKQRWSVRASPLIIVHWGIIPPQPDCEEKVAARHSAR